MILLGVLLLLVLFFVIAPLAIPVLITLWVLRLVFKRRKHAATSTPQQPTYQYTSSQHTYYDDQSGEVFDRPKASGSKSRVHFE